QSLRSLAFHANLALHGFELFWRGSECWRDFREKRIACVHRSTARGGGNTANGRAAARTTRHGIPGITVKQGDLLRCEAKGVGGDREDGGPSPCAEILCAHLDHHGAVGLDGEVAFALMSAPTPRMHGH